MKKIKIFLASSSELAEERNQLEILIGRENKKYIDKGLFIDLIIWEDFIDSMSKTRLQDEYNNAILQCDIFISMFFTKAGKYTHEEFDIAYNAFKAGNKPQYIYVFFKDAEINTGSINESIMSLLNFKSYVGNLGHFYTPFKNIEDLKFRIKDQFDKIFPKLIEEETDITENKTVEKKEIPKEINTKQKQYNWTKIFNFLFEGFSKIEIGIICLDSNLQIIRDDYEGISNYKELCDNIIKTLDKQQYNKIGNIFFVEYFLEKLKEKNLGMFDHLKPFSNG